MADSTKIIIRDLRVDMLIGIHDHEKTALQPVLINIEVEIPDNTAATSGNIGETLCYDQTIKSVRALASRGHINLVETLAEEIARMILTHPKTKNVTVRVEKTEVYSDCRAVGVEIFRDKKSGLAAN